MALRRVRLLFDAGSLTQNSAVSEFRFRRNCWRCRDWHWRLLGFEPSGAQSSGLFAATQRCGGLLTEQPFTTARGKTTGWLTALRTRLLTEVANFAEGCHRQGTGVQFFEKS
jgi:hypothetical protein